MEVVAAVMMVVGDSDVSNGISNRAVSVAYIEEGVDSLLSL